jgi:hypothetical protein
MAKIAELPVPISKIFCFGPTTSLMNAERKQPAGMRCPGGSWTSRPNFSLSTVLLYSLSALGSPKSIFPALSSDFSFEFL